MAVGLLEYAEHRGVSRRAVQKAIDSGRLQRSVSRQGRRWMIDVGIADLEWARNTAPEKARSARQINGGKARARGEDAESPDELMPPPPPGRPGAPGGGASTYQQAKAAGEGYRAMLLKLEYEERAGKLTDAKAVEARLFEAGRKVRDSVMRTSQAMVVDIAAAVGGLTPEQRAKVLQVIDRHHVQALEALSRAAG